MSTQITRIPRAAALIPGAADGMRTGTCPTKARIRAISDPHLREAFLRDLDDPAVRPYALARVLRHAGITAHGISIAAHRDGKCSCEPR